MPTTLVSDNFAGSAGTLTGRTPPVGAPPWEEIPPQPSAPWLSFGPMALTGAGAAKGTSSDGRSGNVIDAGAADVVVTATFTPTPMEPHALLLFRFVNREEFICLHHSNTQGFWLYQSVLSFPGFPMFGSAQLADGSYHQGFGRTAQQGQPTTVKVAVSGAVVTVTINGEDMAPLTLMTPFAEATRAGIGGVSYSPPATAWDQFTVESN